VRLVRRVTPFIHSIDHAIGRLRPRREVLVEYRTPVYQAVLGPVAEALAREPNVRVWFTSEYPERIAPLVPAGSFLTHRDVEWRRFDVYLNADPWAAARLRRCAHRVNFFHGVAGKYDLDRPDGLPLGFEYYDRVAFINRDRKQRYLDARIVTAAQAVLVGYPKLDRLANGELDGTAVRASLGLDARRPTALYAPTYSEASSLHLAGEEIVESLAGAGFNVIVKLHDRSLDQSQEKYSGGIDWRARFAMMGQRGRIAFSEAADSSPLLAASDVMVTDHSSIGFEFYLLDRPLVVFDAPDLVQVARINPVKVALLRSAARVVQQAGEVGPAAADELAHGDRRSGERRAIVREMFHAPGSATARALDMVYDLLEVPPPAPSRAPSHAVETAGSVS